ncbi:DUF2797 domain-containing protein [Streptomyces sp. NPDC051940]|uniref:DUF2797 domain-containing protein n=1 Tax=Streptomyces sp. NPDC051940 TaxID=3155675 RepID=UPI00342BD159
MNDADDLWRCGGLRWSDGAPGWRWWHPRGGERKGGRLAVGDGVALAVPEGAVRRCAGVVRAGRRTPCPDARVLAAESHRDQCDACAALDRSQSVAADTVPDDPRPYSVYLAWFAPGLTKVGITAVERGSVRLLEQAAVCFTFLGRGPLMSARRAEAVLGAGLGIPDRVHSARKREGRLRLPGPDERVRELRAVYDAAARVPGWRDTLEPAGFAPVDHAAAFGLEPAPPRPAAQLTALAPGCAVTGVLRAAAGPDLYLATDRGELLVDSRLALAWPLTRPGPRSRPAPTTPVVTAQPAPEALF